MAVDPGPAPNVDTLRPDDHFLILLDQHIVVHRGVIGASIAAQGMPTRHEWLAASFRGFRASPANASVTAQRRAAALGALRDPTPLLGNGRALNFTARRNGAAFDIGVMDDNDKIADIEGVVALFAEAYAEYRPLSLSRSDQP